MCFMKKQYIRPTLKVFMIKPTNIIATSNLGQGSGTQPNAAQSKDMIFYDDYWFYND